MDSIYQSQLEKASKYITVYERSVISDDEPEFVLENGHFNCGCSHPGLTQSGKYVSLAFYETKSNVLVGEPLLNLTINSEDGYWQENPDTFNEWFFNGSWGSTFGLHFGNWNRSLLTDKMLALPIYVRLVNNTHINDMVTVAEEIEEINSPIGMGGWACKYPGAYYNPASFDPVNGHNMDISEMRFHSEAYYDMFLKAYKLGKKQQSGLKLKKIISKEGNANTSSTIYSPINFNKEQLVEAIYNVSPPFEGWSDPSPYWTEVSDDPELG